MEGFDPAESFGTSVAERYNDHPRGDEESTASFLAKRAQGGRALEFAIGTGRIALPLVALGVEVDGIELSHDMVARLRAKPGGERREVTMGDMSVATTGRRYNLVYLVYNTLFNLLTVDDQIRCFENAARHLSGDGIFVVETAVPHAWIQSGQSDYVHAEHIGMDSVTLDVARYDPATQLFEENHIVLSAQGIRMRPIVCRLITPGEMDLMARIAGLCLVERFANWQQSPFDVHSRAHVSVYAIKPRQGSLRQDRKRNRVGIEGA